MNKRKWAVIVLIIVSIYPVYLIIQQSLDAGEPNGWENLCLTLGFYFLGSGLVIFGFNLLFIQRSVMGGGLEKFAAVVGAAFLAISFTDAGFLYFTLLSGTPGLGIWVIFAVGITAFIGLALLPFIRSIHVKKSSGTEDMD